MSCFNLRLDPVSAYVENNYLSISDRIYECAHFSKNAVKILGLAIGSAISTAAKYIVSGPSKMLRDHAIGSAAASIVISGGDSNLKRIITVVTGAMLSKVAERKVLISPTILAVGTAVVAELTIAPLGTEALMMTALMGAKRALLTIGTLAMIEGIEAGRDRFLHEIDANGSMSYQERKAVKSFFSAIFHNEPQLKLGGEHENISLATVEQIVRSRSDLTLSTTPGFLHGMIAPLRRLQSMVRKLENPNAFSLKDPPPSKSSIEMVRLVCQGRELAELLHDQIEWPLVTELYNSRSCHVI